MKVAITGSSGLIGTALRRRLRDQGHEVIRVVRSSPEPGEVLWDPMSGEIDKPGLDGVEAVVHLAGAGIGDERLTDERKQLVKESRTRGTRLIAETVAAMAPTPVLVSASAMGYYGDRGDEVLTEDSSAGNPDDFLVDVVTAWEAATQPAVDAGARVVLMRTGIVLDDDGGALGKMLAPFKFGLGGRIGDGKQWWSWISIEDMVDVILHLIDSDLSGPVNVGSPNPVRNAEFVDTLGDVLNRPTILPTPKLGLYALLGKERADVLLFTSARIIPKRLEADGFQFRHPDLHQALEATLA